MITRKTKGVIQEHVFGKPFPVKKEVYERVRDADEGEVEPLIRIAQRVPHIDKDLLTQGSMGEFMSQSTNFLLVHGEVGRPTGFIAGKIDPITGIGRILYTGVKSGLERKGIGSALLTTACKRLEKSGARIIFCDGETVKSDRLLRKYGLEQDGMRCKLLEQN